MSSGRQAVRVKNRSAKRVAASAGSAERGKYETSLPGAANALGGGSERR